MEEFILPLFPEGELSTSLICTVGIGVMVTAFFNLRFGWLLSGLIVPGYMAPIIFTSPLAGTIIIFEGVVAYLMTAFISKKGAQWNLWSEFFGRDRFFAIVLFSTIVKVFFDSFLLPICGNFFESRFNILFDYQNNLHSFGLVIIALIANQFWKRGLKGEIFPFLVVLGTTYLVVRYGLMEWTNFRITGISYLYNDLFLTFLASPRAYIILLVTTLIVTRMNVDYGWDYGGILVAGLLALEWYFPLRVFVTLGEAFLVYVIASYLLKSRPFEGADITGARQLVLFFVIGFIYKFLLGWWFTIFAPEVKILDLFGFGYLLSTFIAITMYESQAPIRIFSSLLQTSFLGAVLGTAISIAVSMLPYPETLKKLFPQQEFPAVTIFPDSSLQEKHSPQKIEKLKGYLTAFLLERKELSAEKGTNLYKVPTVEELYVFDKKVLTPLLQLINQPINQSKLEEINGFAIKQGYSISLFEEGNISYLILAENTKNSHRHYGATFIFRLGKVAPFMFEVPYPLFEVNTAEAALYLFEDIKGKALIFSEAHPQTNLDGSSDLIKPHNKNSYFNIGSQVILRSEKDNPFMLVQVRGYSSPDPFIPLKGSKSDADVFLAFNTGAEQGEFSPLEKDLYNVLSREKLKILIVNNTEETEGYDVTQMQSFRYLNQTKNKYFSIVWFSQNERTLLRTPDHDLLRLSHMSALNIPVQTKPLQQLVQEKGIENGGKIPAKAQEAFQNYLDSEDIIYLQELIENINPFKLNYVIDPQDQHLYLIVLDKKIKKVFQLWPRTTELQETTKK